MPEEKTPSRGGIRDMTRRLACLQTPPNVPEGAIWRYGYGFPFQVSPTHAAILANIHRKQAPIEDFEVGADVIVFDDLKGMVVERSVRVAQIHREINPKVNEMSAMVKQCPVGGFVPRGAKRADGSPHPHAGTGFGVVMAISYALDEDPSTPYRGCFLGEESYVYYELQQYAFDGKDFRVTGTERMEMDTLFPGHLYLNSPMRMAIADGDDLLAGVAMGRPGAVMENILGKEEFGTGVARWSRDGGKWRMVDFSPVAMDFQNFEPSLARDVDGSLLFSSRPGYESDCRRDALVWHSPDNGKSWKRILHVKNIRYQSPVTLNNAVDGTPYLIGNLLLSALMDYKGKFMDGLGRITCREMLCLWALDSDRTGLVSPLIASFPRYEYGRPPVAAAVDASDSEEPLHGRDWSCDHPNAMNVRLADGQWHHLLCYRLLSQAEVQGGILPTPHSGLRIEEIFSTGAARPEWNF